MPKLEIEIPKEHLKIWKPKIKNNVSLKTLKEYLEAFSKVKRATNRELSKFMKKNYRTVQGKTLALLSLELIDRIQIYKKEEGTTYNYFLSEKGIKAWEILKKIPAL